MTSPRLVDHQVAIKQRANPLHALGPAIPLDRLAVGDEFGEFVQQPLGFDGTHEPGDRRTKVGTFFDLRQDEQSGPLYRAILSLLYRDAAHHAQFEALAAAADAVGEGPQQRAAQPLGVTAGTWTHEPAKLLLDLTKSRFGPPLHD